jgi:hypothetical protein
MRYSHFAHVSDPGVFRRRLSQEQAQRVVRMKNERGLTWGAIAHWFTRNGTPVSYQAVRETYRRQNADRSS